jgi:hypothetical protein
MLKSSLYLQLYKIKFDNDKEILAMDILFIIHRSKKPFSLQKEVFRKITDFYSARVPGLQFIDKGIRFSIKTPNHMVDFTFGYQNMRYQDFSQYQLVVSQGPCGFFNEEMNPGDIAFPTSSDCMRVNSEGTKVRVYEKGVKFENRMAKVFEGMMEFESKYDLNPLREFVCAELSYKQGAEVTRLSEMKVQKEARFVEANTIFRPSKIQGARAILRSGEYRIEVPDLKAYLLKYFDGVSFETKQMIENAGEKMLMYRVGMNKPFANVEYTDEIRDAEHPEELLPTYQEQNVNYFQAALFGYLLMNDFQTA